MTKNSCWKKNLSLFLSLLLVFSSVLSSLLILSINSPLETLENTNINAESEPADIYTEIPSIQSLGLWEISQLNWSETNVVNVFVEGDICYLSCYSAGIKLVNISDALNPVLISEFYDGGFARAIAKKGDYLYVADGLDGLEVLKISNVTNIQKVYQFFDGGSALDVIISGNFAFVADGTDGLEVFDISAIETPIEIDQMGFMYSAAQALSHNAIQATMEIAYGSIGLVYCNIQDPENIYFDGYYSFSQTVKDVYSMQDKNQFYTWAATGSQGVYYVCMTIWGLTYVIASYYDGGIANAIEMVDLGLLVADGFDGLEVLQYWGGVLREAYYYCDGGWALNIAYDDTNNLIFTADSSDGLEIIGRDTDNDRLADISEGKYGTDPNNADSDGDNFYDGVEIYYSSDPLDPMDTPDIPTPTTPTITLPTTEFPTTLPSSSTDNSSITNNVPSLGMVLALNTLLLMAIISLLIYKISKKKN